MRRLQRLLAYADDVPAGSPQPVRLPAVLIIPTVVVVMTVDLDHQIGGVDEDVDVT